MIEMLAYEKLMADYGLKASELNDEARIGIKTILDVRKSIKMHESKGKTVSADVIKKIKANDKWICGEILEYVDGREINKDDSAPHAVIDVEADPNKAVPADNNTPAVDSVGIKIDADLKKVYAEGKTTITSDELKVASPEAYATIAGSYEQGGENGLETSFYSLTEKETGIFALKEL